MLTVPQIVNIDSSSTIAIYQLSTVGTTYSLSVNQAGVVKSSSNPDGLQVRHVCAAAEEFLLTLRCRRH
jgi:hypothetical protein